MKIFDDAVKKLALTYVAVLMIVSLSASIAMYKIADNQFDRGLRRQQSEFIVRQGPKLLRELEELRLRELDNARANLLFGLVIFNSIVLIGGGYLSYISAKATLRPIKDSMEAQSQFTADASHELRTPLSAIKSETEVALRNKKLNLEEARAVLASNLEEVDNLEQLTSGLLALARMPSSELHLKNIDLKKVADSALSQVKKSSDSKTQLINDIPKKFLVLADEQLLDRLLVILIDNAVKYSGSGGRVKVRADQKGDKAILSVEDNGIGIKKSDLNKIFDRFYRADKSRTASGDVKGYGLGLAIAKNIAEKHGSHIEVVSTEGEGSIFSFELKKPSSK